MQLHALLRPWAIALVLFSSILSISADSHKGIWVSHEDLDLARSDAATVSYDHNIYVFGGSRLAEEGDKSGKVLNTLVRYNPKDQEHTQLADMPEARYRMGYAELNGKIYLFQGHDVYGSFTYDNQSTMIYDIANDNWSTVEAANTEVLRSDMCAASAGGKVYAFGGYQPSNETNDTSDEIDEFDPETQAWTRLPAKLNRARGDCAAVTVDGKIYVLGGVEYNPEGHNADGVDCSNTTWPESRKCYAFSAAVEVFDPANPNSTTDMASMKMGRGDFGAAVIPGGHILVAGGETRDVDSNVFRLLATDKVELYNMTSNEWMEMTSLPVGKFRGGMAAANGVGILVGGVPSCTGNNETVCLINAKKSIHAFHVDSSTLASQEGSSTVSIKLSGVGFNETDYEDETEEYMEFKNSFEENLEREVTQECGCQPEVTINSVSFASRRRSLLSSHDVTVSATVNNALPSFTSAAMTNLEEGGSLGGYTVTEASATNDNGGNEDDGAQLSHLSALAVLFFLAALLA